jgi:hypothetical protein
MNDLLCVSSLLILVLVELQILNLGKCNMDLASRSQATLN